MTAASLEQCEDLTTKVTETLEADETRFPASRTRSISSRNASFIKEQPLMFMKLFMFPTEYLLLSLSPTSTAPSPVTSGYRKPPLHFTPFHSLNLYHFLSVNLPSPCLPACLPACLLACVPASLPPYLPPSLPP
eukprot:382030-Hanusia_phi.AAC.1